MNFQQLKIIREAARRDYNLTEVANMLYTSQSGVSRHIRELEEELGIRVDAARPLIQVHHDYPDKQVLLDVWEVSAISGEPHGAEGQPLAWVGERELLDYEFPAANQPIVAAARLPTRRCSPNRREA